jgi:hypothetical protein
MNYACPRSRPAISVLWPHFAEQSDKEGWRAARLLSALVEHEELAERDRRRVERHIVQARLLPGKTRATFGFTAVPALGETVPRTVSGPLGLSKAHTRAITAPLPPPHRPLSANARIRREGIG